MVAKLGMNLYGSAYDSPDFPYLNFFKQAATKDAPFNVNGWAGRGLEGTFPDAYAKCDANDFPISMEAANHPGAFFTKLDARVGNQHNSYARSGATHPAGIYVLLWDGTGTIGLNGFDGSGSILSSTTGRIVFNVAVPTNGISIAITATSPAPNNIRNIRVVYSPDAGAGTGGSTAAGVNGTGTREALLNSGEIFNPDYINGLMGFDTIRFMQMQGNYSNLSPVWADRTTEAKCFWSKVDGIPIEVMAKLCNKINANAWVCHPFLGDNTYTNGFATAMLGLNPGLKCYHEYGNEIWLTGRDYLGAAGQPVYPGLATAPQAGFQFGINEAVRTGGIFKSVWTSAGRGGDVIRILAAQGAVDPGNSIYYSCDALASDWGSTQPTAWTGPAWQHFDAISGGLYFGDTILNDILRETFVANGLSADTNYSALSGAQQTTINNYITAHYTVDNVFSRIPAALASASSWTAPTISGLSTRGALPFIMYEGGQHLVVFSASQGCSPLVNLGVAANRDSRISGYVQTWWNNWVSNGGGLAVFYNYMFEPSQYGFWGARESAYDKNALIAADTSIASPKYDQLMSILGGAGTAPSNTVAPAISGTALVGQTLSVTNGTWTGDPTITFTYQWRANSISILGATGSTFILTNTQIGANMTCTVTGTNGAGSSSATSNSIGPVSGNTTFTITKKHHKGISLAG